MKINLAMQVDADELWSSVFGSGFDTFPWWHSVQFLDGAEWNVRGTVELEIDDPEFPEGSGKYRTMYVNVYDLAAHWRVGDDPEDMDSIAADALLQSVIFGTEVYG